MTIEREIKTVLNRALSLQNNATKEFLKLIDELRERIILTVMDQREISSYSITQIKQVIAQLTDDYQNRFIEKMSEDQRRQFIKGIQVIDATIDKQNLLKSVPYLSEEVLNKSKTLGAELITGLTDDVRGSVNKQLTLGVMGQKSSQEIIKEIGSKLDKASVFGTIRRRAELIYRTEMNRIQTMASAERMEQLAEKYPDLKKKWVHSHVGMPRVNHEMLDGEVIPAKDMFTLPANPMDKRNKGRTYQVYAPYDPKLPPSETINCRCKVIAVFPQIYKQINKPSQINIKEKNSWQKERMMQRLLNKISKQNRILAQVIQVLISSTLK